MPNLTSIYLIATIFLFFYYIVFPDFLAGFLHSAQFFLSPTLAQCPQM